MENNQIIEGNKFIAEFMNENEGYDEHRVWQRFQYHSSWDQLWPVIEKIESLDKDERVSHTYSIEITGNGTTVYKNIYSHGESNIIFRKNIKNERRYCTWLVVIEFIKWYNLKNNQL